METVSKAGITGDILGRLQCAANALETFIEKQLNKTRSRPDLALGHMILLLRLRRAGKPLSIRGLRSECYVGNDLTYCVKILEKKEYLTRAPQDEDRRYKGPYALTPKGVQVAQLLEPILQYVEANVGRVFSLSLEQSQEIAHWSDMIGHVVPQAKDTQQTAPSQ